MSKNTTTYLVLSSPNKHYAYVQWTGQDYYRMAGAGPDLEKLKKELKLLNPGCLVLIGQRIYPDIPKPRLKPDEIQPYFPGYDL